MSAVDDGERAADDIAQERAAQDQQWGGPAHDDEHASADWVWLIRSQIDAADPNDPRGRLVKIAALAIAGIESIDRRATR